MASGTMKCQAVLSQVVGLLIIAGLAAVLSAAGLGMTAPTQAQVQTVLTVHRWLTASVTFEADGIGHSVLLCDALLLVKHGMIP